MNILKNDIRELTAKIAEKPDNPLLLFERGKAYWKLGEKAKAMTDFNAALSLDPESPAKQYLEMANDIMDFYNTDLYNP